MSAEKDAVGCGPGNFVDGEGEFGGKHSVVILGSNGLGFGFGFGALGLGAIDVEVVVDIGVQDGVFPSIVDPDIVDTSSGP